MMVGFRTTSYFGRGAAAKQRRVPRGDRQLKGIWAREQIVVLWTWLIGLVPLSLHN